MEALASKTATRSLDTLGKSDRQSFCCLLPRVFNGVEVRCQTCAGCRRLKGWQVWKKVTAENAAAARVWYVTLTVRRSAGYRHVSAVLKRIRAAAARQDCTVRFFCAEETGSKRGRLHWHLLLFLDKPLVRDQLANKQVWVKKEGKRVRITVKRWSHGFHDWRLVKSNEVAAYVSKTCGYVTKGGKFRGSNFLGQAKGSFVMQNDLVKQALALFPDAKVRRVGNADFWREKAPPVVGLSPHRLSEIREIHRETEGGDAPGWVRFRLIKPLAFRPRKVRSGSVGE